MCKQSSYPLSKHFNTPPTFSAGIFNSQAPFLEKVLSPSSLKGKGEICSRRAPLSEPWQGRVAAGWEQELPWCATPVPPEPPRRLRRGHRSARADSEPSRELP